MILALIPSSCGGSGGGSPDQNPANQRTGIPGVEVDLDGAWRIEDVSVIENTATAGIRPWRRIQPIPGMLLQLSNRAVVSIDGVLAGRTDIESELARTSALYAELDWFANGADGRSIAFGFGWDDRSRGGVAVHVGMRGLAVSKDRILVEAAWTFERGSLEAARFHYVLARVSP